MAGALIGEFEYNCNISNKLKIRSGGIFGNQGTSLTINNNSYPFLIIIILLELSIFFWPFYWYTCVMTNGNCI
jgi:hypothetical protein